ncbi:MAG: hypothetical protein EZS28_023986 [Streblomastix strix]|uniref:Uncharacterized protein n=1 Tax=Streblomastix strix TaxID=222440 RepID=A0A5J4VD58_9EUKA|nr:MAG: hypothetical protein EZS28_023986 [Streblomastix strix]
MSICPATFGDLQFSVLSCLICLVFRLRQFTSFLHDYNFIALCPIWQESKVSAYDSMHSVDSVHMDNSIDFSMIQIYGMDGIMAALFHRSPRICPVPKSVPH